jgi:hypothetical protein
MSKVGFIPLRYSHAFRTKFTPRIERKPIAPALFPFCLKRIETAPVTDEARLAIPR